MDEDAVVEDDDDANIGLTPREHFIRVESTPLPLPTVAVGHHRLLYGLALGVSWLVFLCADQSRTELCDICLRPDPEHRAPLGPTSPRPTNQRTQRSLEALGLGESGAW